MYVVCEWDSICQFLNVGNRVIVQSLSLFYLGIVVDIPSLKFSASSCGSNLGHRAWEVLSGIAADYWKDGEEIPFVKKKKKAFVARKTAASSGGEIAQAEEKGLWHAGYPEIVEAIWGKGHNLPLGDDFIDKLAAPVGLDKSNGVLDLSAGLGAVGRRIASEFGAYVTGLEPDQALAEYGMEISTQANQAKKASVYFYDPDGFVEDKHYDFIIARELFYKIPDKKRFFKEIKNSLKKDGPRGHLTFTDYILEPESRKDPAILAWLKNESPALPLPLKEMKKMWTKNGFDVRVSEDLTDTYKKEILKGLSGFAQFLRTNKPDSETKKLVFSEIETWALRVSAFEHGLKFYRFYAMR